jgi:hypothetical protein
MERQAAREVRPISASFAGQHNANVRNGTDIYLPGAYDELV